MLKLDKLDDIAKSFDARLAGIEEKLTTLIQIQTLSVSNQLSNYGHSVEEISTLLNDCLNVDVEVTKANKYTQMQDNKS